MNRLVNSSSGDGSTARRRVVQSRIAPAATRASASVGARYPLPSLAAVMAAPERQSMPLIHPNRENGGLWFGIDDCLRKDIVAAYQSNFWGPWWNYSMVPDDKKTEWWTTFVQKYYWDPIHHNMVYEKWESITRKSIGGIVSKRRRNGKKPPFIGVGDWGIMQETWEEERHQKRSKTNAENSSSNKDGLGPHRHTSGSIPHIRVAHNMKEDAGGEDIPLTAVVLKTHTKKDGTVIDKRAESLVRQAEELAISRSQSLSESDDVSSGSTPSNEAITAAYLEMAKNKKGRIYGLGSIQYLQVSPKDNAAALLRHAESQSILTGLQKDIVGLKAGQGGMQDDIGGLKAGMDLLLRMNGVDPKTHQLIQSPASVRSGHSEPSQHNNNIVSSTNNNDPIPADNQNNGPTTANKSPINLANATPHSLSFSNE